MEMGWKKKRREKPSVTMEAWLFTWNHWFVNGAECEADAAELAEQVGHFAARRIPFFASVEIREQTVTVTSSRGIERAAHCQWIQTRLVCCTQNTLCIFAKNDFFGILMSICLFFSKGFMNYFPHVSPVLNKTWLTKQWVKKNRYPPLCNTWHNNWCVDLYMHALYAGLPHSEGAMYRCSVNA